MNNKSDFFELEKQGVSSRIYLDALTGLRGVAALWVALWHTWRFSGRPVYEWQLLGFSIDFTPLIRTGWAGVDVQHILQEATPDGVRAHVRDLIDTFHVPGAGRCVVAAGNGITGSTPLENIDAFLDETFRYGLTVGRKS